MRFEALLSTPRTGTLGTIEFVGRILGGTGVEPRHQFRQYQSYGLTLVTAGRGDLWTADAPPIAVGAGDSIITLPQVPHWFGPPAGEAWDELFVTFHGPQFDLMRHTGLLAKETLIRHEVTASRIQKLTRDPWETSVLSLASLLLERPSYPGQEPAWMKEAERRLADLSFEGKSIPQLASELGLAHDAFRRSFAKVHGQSPLQYRNQRRLELAVEMLQRTSLSISEIARRLGYADPFAFSKAFRSAIGVSPRDFRQRTR
jgi:AraC-like DNA-binding protein